MVPSAAWSGGEHVVGVFGEWQYVLAKPAEAVRPLYGRRRTG
ncbi:MAG: hypothetical protein R2710_29960 [Acidimicrobiales bacterium]